MDKKKVEEALAVIYEALKEEAFQDWKVDNQVDIDEGFEENQFRAMEDIEEDTTYNLFALRKYIADKS
jgi:hypothetical protein